MGGASGNHKLHKSNRGEERVHRRREVCAIKRSSRTREVNVNPRCKAPTPRRCASPNVTTSVNAATQLAPKRGISTPPSPSPTTPAHDTYVEPLSRKVIGSRLPESLWPSTMRSLSVSFQSDSISIPVSKKEKSVSGTLCDTTLKQSERASVIGKTAPERRRSPLTLRGRNSSDQSENSRPVDQHRWPSRNTLMKSTHLSDKAGKSSSLTLPIVGVSSLRRPLHRAMSDETVLRVSMLHKLNLSKSSHLLARSRLPSPSKASASRGMTSPCCTRPTSSRGTSPLQIRPCSPTWQFSNVTSVLSFVSHLKRGNKSTNQLEDVHRLRLLYNRYLQWRFANAQSEAASHIQQVIAEETLYNVWWENQELWDSVITKHTNLQQLQLQLDLNVVLNEQVAYLEDWASLEREHSVSLAGVINDLESSTLRLPITDGARADVVSLKAAISSAVDVMYAMTSSIHSVLSKVEVTNCSVSELAEVVAQERAMLDECEAMLSSTASMQVEKYSLRAQLIQRLQGLRQ